MPLIESILGWVANLLLIICSWRLAHKDRWALLFGAAGGFLWAIKAIATHQLDLLSIEIILASLQLHAWYKWGKSP